MAFSPFLRFRLVWSSAFAWQHNNNLLCPKLNRGMKVNRSGAEHAKRPPRSGFVQVGHSETIPKRGSRMFGPALFSLGLLTP